MADPEDESPTKPETRSSVTRGIASLFLWNQVLVISSLFLAMLGVNSLMTEVTITKIAISVFLLLLAIGLLITSADFFVEGAKGLARRIGVAEIIIGLTIVSLGTSLPEILISSQAAWEARQNPCIAGAADCATDFALGNIYGSVLVQITLILGIVVLIRPLTVRPSWIGRDGVMMLFAVVLLSVFLLLDDKLSRIEGFILCALYVCYIGYLVSHREQIRKDEFVVIEEIRIEQERTLDWTSTSYVVMLAVGLALAMFASGRVIDAASIIAVELGVPSAVVGTTISAVGTSIPELAVALMAARRSQGVAIGTLIGSNITDPMLSVGLAAMINPITVMSTGLFYGLIMPATIACVALCLLFMWTDFKFNRWEGGILVGCYALFIYLLLYIAG